MAGELTSAFTGGNRLHENKTAIRTITLSSGGSPVDLRNYTNFRSSVRDAINGTAFNRTATVTITNSPGTDGTLTWQLERVDTQAMADSKAGTGNVAFVTDIKADWDGSPADATRIDYLGSGTGSLQQEITTST